MTRVIPPTFLLFVLSLAGPVSAQKSGDGALGTRKYSDYEAPRTCGACHTDFYQQWVQMMMSQAYVHHWDEIEYFKLAVPHAEKDTFVAGVRAGSNGCHTPVAFLAGDVPPPKPEINSRANEAVTCDVCHTITAIDGEVPHNYSFISEPGRVKYGPRAGVASPAHETRQSGLYNTAEVCGSCHNEKSPHGVWVKSTQLEWKEGPYSKEGVVCQDCHMPKAAGRVAGMGTEFSDARQHFFHGAHDPGKIRGAIELRIHPDTREVEPGLPVRFTVLLYNAKAGHKIPTGSAEERMLWLHVEAIDSKGNVYHIPVDRKGFAGEGFTIAADTLAYQDMGIPLGIPGFAGVQRDGVPVGDRIFRLPYLDPQGRMTIMQWNTASQGVDYRIGPRETKVETCTWQLPDTIAAGLLVVRATLNYQKLPTPIAQFLGVPAEEAEIIHMNTHETNLTVVD